MIEWNNIPDYLAHAGAIVTNQSSNVLVTHGGCLSISGVEILLTQVTIGANL